MLLSSPFFQFPCKTIHDEFIYYFAYIYFCTYFHHLLLRDGEKKHVLVLPFRLGSNTYRVVTCHYYYCCYWKVYNISFFTKYETLLTFEFEKKKGICMNEIELNGRAQVLYVYYRVQLLCPFVYVCHDYYYIVIVYKQKMQCERNSC